MPSEKLHRCVSHVMEQGHDESSAYAICRTSLALSADGSEDEKAIGMPWEEIVQNVATQLNKNKTVIARGDSPLFIMNADVPAEIARSTEIHLMPIGEWKGKIQNGEVKQFRIGENEISQMVRNFNALGRDVVIDYEHQTLSGDEAPAAGWIKRLVNKGKEGLWAAVEWTDRALNYLRSKEYRFLSPVFTLEGIDPKSGKKVGAMLLNAALTNDPFFSELKPITSKSDGADAKNVGPTIFLTQEEYQMNKLIARLREVYQLAADATEDQILAKFNQVYEGTTKVVAAKQKVAGILGLKPEATLEEIEAAVVVAKGHITELAKALDLKPEATVEEIKAAIVTAKAGAGELPKMAARLLALEAKDFDREFDRIIGKAFEAGKILPVSKNDPKYIDAQKAFAAKDIKAFEDFWGKQPVVGPVQKIPETGEGTKGAGITETDLVIAKVMGVTEEQLKKHNPAN